MSQKKRDGFWDISPRSTLSRFRREKRIWTSCAQRKAGVHSLWAALYAHMSEPPVARCSCKTRPRHIFFVMRIRQTLAWLRAPLSLHMLPLADASSLSARRGFSATTVSPLHAPVVRVTVCYEIWSLSWRLVAALPAVDFWQTLCLSPVDAAAVLHATPKGARQNAADERDRGRYRHSSGVCTCSSGTGAFSGNVEHPV